MATIHSAQTGNWSSTSTWTGGVVPDLAVDDVVIDNTHQVNVIIANSLFLNSGRTITVNLGVLNIAGGDLKVDGVLAIPGGTVDVDASGITLGQLIVRSGGAVNISPNGALTLISGRIVVNFGGTITIGTGSLVTNGLLTTLDCSGTITATGGGVMNIQTYTILNITGGGGGSRVIGG